MATNPFLQQQADSIATNLTTNLNRNVLPQFRRGSVAAGGWGNSAGGIAQGIAAGDTSRAIADAQGNLYSQAYEGDQNRSNQMGIASMQAQTQRDIATMNDATNRYGLGNTYDLGLKSNALGWGGLDTQRYGMDLNHSLGLGNLGVSQQNADTSRDLGWGQIGLGYGQLANSQQQTQNAFTLGSQQNENQRYGIDQNTGLGYAGLGNQYNIAQMGNETQRYGMDQNYDLGMGNLNLGYQNSNNSYDLGQQNIGLGYFNGQNSYNLGLGGLNNQATANNQNFYTAQRGQDLQQNQQGFDQYLGSLNAQLGIGDQLTNIGNQQYAAERDPLNVYGQGVNPYTGLNSTQSTTGPQTGGGIAGAIGGGMTAAQLWQLFNNQFGQP